MFSTQPYQRKIQKPWGYEVLFTPVGKGRLGKLLFVQAGKRLSLQYHDEKEETLCLLSGQAVLWLEQADGTVAHLPMELQKGYEISLLQKHRIEAVSDIVVVESSGDERGNTFRLEDDYRRTTETEAVRASGDRGWNGADDSAV